LEIYKHQTMARQLEIIILMFAYRSLSRDHALGYARKEKV